MALPIPRFCLELVCNNDMADGDTDGTGYDDSLQGSHKPGDEELRGWWDGNEIRERR